MPGLAHRQATSCERRDQPLARRHQLSPLPIRQTAQQRRSEIASRVPETQSDLASSRRQPHRHCPSIASAGAFDQLRNPQAIDQPNRAGVSQADRQAQALFSCPWCKVEQRHQGGAGLRIDAFVSERIIESVHHRDRKGRQQVS